MFYPHTIKGKPTFKFVPVVEPPTEGPPLGGLQGWLQGSAGLTTDSSANDYTVSNTDVTIGTALNGHDTFRYNGTSAFQSFGNVFGTPASYTITAVVALDTVLNRNGLWGSTVTGVGSGTWGETTVSHPGPSLEGEILTAFSKDGFGNSDNATTTTPLTNSVYSIITIRYVGSGVVSEILIDGVLQATSQTGSNADSNTGTPQIFNIGNTDAVPTPGGPASLNNYMGGNVAEWLFYDIYLDGALYTDKIDYLTDRYNL